MLSLRTRLWGFWRHCAFNSNNNNNNNNKKQKTPEKPHFWANFRNYAIRSNVYAIVLYFHNDIILMSHNVSCVVSKILNFFCKIDRKIPVSGSLFNKKTVGCTQLYYKGTPAQLFSCEFCKIFNITFPLQKTSGLLLLKRV